MTSSHLPLAGRSVWTGTELEQAGDWIRTLDDAQRDEIHAALQGVKGRGVFDFGREDFPLPRTAGLLADISEELENGRGCVRLRGIDVGRYGEDDLRRIFWGIGRHLGTAVYQNARGEIMGEVRDETRLTTRTYEETEEGRVAVNGAAAVAYRSVRCDRAVVRAQCAGGRSVEAGVDPGDP